MSTRSDRPGPAIVLRDAAGAYYVVPAAVVEACRVPEPMVPELLAAIEHKRSDDTDGFAGGPTYSGAASGGLMLVFLGPLVGTAIGAAIGAGVTNQDQGAAAELKKQSAMGEMNAGHMRPERRHWP